MTGKITKTLSAESSQSVAMFVIFLIDFLCSAIPRVLHVTKIKRIYLYGNTDLSTVALHRSYITSRLENVYSLSFFPFFISEIKISMAALNHPHAVITQYFNLWPP